MSRIIFTFLLLALAMVARAQLNESDTVTFQWRNAITGSYQQGNVEALAIRGRVDLSYRPWKKIVFKTQNSFLYQRFFKSTADDDLFSRNYLYFFPDERLYPFAIGYISTNYRRKIETRYFAGAGITYQLLDKKRQVIKIAVSAVYEHSLFNGNVYNIGSYDGSRTIDVWRGTVYAAGWHHLFGQRVRLFYDAFWQPAFSDQSNYRTQVDIGAEMPVWKGLSFTVAYTATHENVVVQKVKEEDGILTFGLSYTMKRNGVR